MFRPNLKSQQHSRSIPDLPKAFSKTHHKLESDKVFQLYSSILNSERLLTPEGSAGSIGPGYYDLKNSTLGGPYCTFSSVQRFPTSYTALPSPVFKEPSNFTLKNMNLAQYHPQNKKDLLRIKAKNEQIRIENAQKTKEQLRKTSKRDKLKKIKEKHNKFRMKIQCVEVKRCAYTWFTLLTLINITTSINYKKTYLKDLRKRSGKLLKFLRAICKFVGKVRILIRKNKVNKALRKLSRFALLVRTWVKKRKMKYIGIVNIIVYKSAAKEKIFRFMFQWKNCLTFIQRSWKRALVEKKISMALRLLYWEKYEKSIFESQKTTRGNKVKFLSLTPQQSKEKLIKVLLKKRIKEYCKNLAKYRAKIKEEFAKQRFNNLKALNGKRNNMNLLIAKPQPNYNFTRKDYIKLIKQASLMRKNSKVLGRGPTLKPS